MAKEEGITHLDDKALSYLLWNDTSFPFGTTDDIKRQLRQALNWKE